MEMPKSAPIVVHTETAAKREAAFVVSGPNSEISKEEIDRAFKQMRSRWAPSYGLMEVG